jgi:chromosome segregation ATPase
MTAQERIEWMDRVWPVGEAVARSAMKDIIADLARVEAELGKLSADLRERANENFHLLDRAQKAEIERDEWKAMADRASQALVERLGEFEKAQDDLAALRAKGENLAEVVGRVQGILDAVDPSSRAAVEIQTICDAALEEWRNP